MKRVWLDLVPTSMMQKPSLPIMIIVSNNNNIYQTNIVIMKIYAKNKCIALPVRIRYVNDGKNKSCLL